MIMSPTFWLILSNIATFLFLGYKGVDLLSPTTYDLINWGGNLGPFTLTGDQSRLFTSMFLHGGVVHLLMNMFLLFQIGYLSEAVWGKMRFAFIYLLTGLFGSLASAYWYSLEALRYPSEPIPTVSVGASGALLGISGALLVHAIVQKDKALIDLKAIAQVVLLNIGMGFMNQGVDNACHIGGAASGIVIGSLLLIPWNTEFKISDRMRTSGVFLLSLSFFVVMLLIPVPGNLDLLASDLRFGYDELQRLETLKQKKIKAEKDYLEELKTVPRPVSMEEAAGKYIVLEGGAVDLIRQNNIFYIPQMDSNSFTKIDTKTFKVINETKGPPLPIEKDSGCRDNLCLGRGVSGIAVSKNGNWAIVSSMVEDSISMFDLQKNEIVWSLKVGTFPRNTYLSNNEKYAFAINSPDNSLTVIDLSDRKVLFTKKIGEELSGYSFGRLIGATQADDKILVADPVRNKIVSMETENPREMKTVIDLGDFSPNRIVFSSNHEKIWISGNADSKGSLRSYDAKSFKLIDVFPTCAAEDVSEFAIGPNDEWIAIEQQESKTLRLVSTKTLGTIRVFPSSSGHNLLRFSEDNKFLYFLSLQGFASALTVFDISKTLDVQTTVAENGEVFCLH
jgi:rhomboid protease GluP